MSFFWTFVLSSFRHILRNGNYGSCGLIICLTYWGTATLIPKVMTSFYIPTSSVWRCRIITIVVVFQFPLLLLLIITKLVGVKYYLIVILACASLMTNDIELCFMCLLVIYISSLKKYLFKSFAHILIGLFIFWLVSCKIILSGLPNPYQRYDL